MCRNIRVLHHFQPPSTDDEIQAAALQYVRKVSGLVKPTVADEPAFEAAVAAIAASTKKLLAALPERGQVRTRENEKLKGKLRWLKRETRMKTA